MTYELAKKLKDAGYSQEDFRMKPVTISNENAHEFVLKVAGGCYFPNLSELIEACGATTKNNPWGDEVGAFEFCLQFSENEWKAGYTDPNYHENWSDREEGATAEEAVANLWLALNEKEA